MGESIERVTCNHKQPRSVYYWRLTRALSLGHGLGIVPDMHVWVAEGVVCEIKADGREGSG